MLNRPVTNDEERQTSGMTAGRNGMDEERTEIASRANECRPKQSLFMCLRGKRQTTYGIRIPCYRPRSRYIKRTIKSEQDGQSSRTELVKNPFYDDDSDIYKKLVAACYQFYGSWKRWVPFYGIVYAKETEFSFMAATIRDNQFEIHPLPLKHDEIKKHHEAILARQPSKLDYALGDHCRPEHSNDCPAGIDGLDEECLEVGYERARRILERLHLDSHLKTCAMDPSKADCLGFSTLEGMALAESPVMSNSDFKVPRATTGWNEPIRRLPGIEIRLGWQTDRIFEEVPSYMVTTVFLLAVTWFVVVVGGQAGDASLWTAIGQLLAASFAMLTVHLR